MIPISEFSTLCQLSPQTLRYYHSEGLLVPSEVDEHTGYRSYTFDQLERAVLITVLRSAGMSVKDVRHALDEPDTAPVLLDQHIAEVRRQRELQDDAIRDAQALLANWPEPKVRHVPEMTVVSKPVPGPAAPSANYYDWEQADAIFMATVKEVIEKVESCGAVVTGSPWRALAIETKEQKHQAITAEGPHWLVKVPITADTEQLAALPDDLEVQTFQARDELSVVLPGRNSTAKYGAAYSRLVGHSIEQDLGGRLVDVTAVRLILHDDSTETALALLDPDGTEDE